MYQTDFLCTYKLMEDADDQDCLYQVQLLQALGLEMWNDCIVNVVVGELYEKLKQYPIVLEIYRKANECPIIRETLAVFRLLDADEIDNDVDKTDPNKYVLRMLFKYEYFDVWHKCIIELVQTSTVSAKTLQALYLLF